MENTSKLKVDIQEKATIQMLSKVIASLLLRNDGKLIISQAEILAAENRTFTIDQDVKTLDLIFQFQTLRPLSTCS